MIFNGYFFYSITRDIGRLWRKRFSQSIRRILVLCPDRENIYEYLANWRCYLVDSEFIEIESLFRRVLKFREKRKRERK